MCISCGCGKPDDNHGDERNITSEDINQAAIAAGTTRDRAIQHMLDGLQQMSQHQPPSGQQQDMNQAQPPAGQQQDDPHQTAQNQTSSVHKTATRTPGEPASSGDGDSGTAFANDLQNPAS
ncbi:MAG: hypothetical protein M3Z08_14755 [Chloroflexota bacterium]|nr:hypothetical protein [Chloroflexota bacterium]